MQTPQFNEKKAIQIAAVFVKRVGVINYVKLIKLMYLSDRKALLNWERPITGDSYLSMNKGPVLSRTLNLIKENQPSESLWAEFITENPPANLHLSQCC